MLLARPSGAAFTLKQQQSGLTGGTRTPYPQLRRLLLYPDELQSDCSWCDWPESNRHALLREILSLLCLPISPQSLIVMSGGPYVTRTRNQRIMSPLL